MGLEPGQFRIIPAERVGLLGLSTHSMPLSLFMDYVQDIAGTVVLVGVQPRTMSFGEGLSPEIVVAGDTLAGLVRTGQVETLEILS
jgi:hydrogenase 3 maturation protease